MKKLRRKSRNPLRRETPPTWSTAGCPQVAPEKPKSGAPNATHSVIPRTSGAEMVENVTYSEQAQKWRNLAPKRGAPNVTHIVISETAAS